MPVSAFRAVVPLVLASVLSLAGAAHAQDVISPQASPQTGIATMKLAVSPEQVQQIVSERLLQDGVTVGLQTLHQELNLTPGQEARWRDFILASNAKAVGQILATLSDDDDKPLNQARSNLALRRDQLAVETRRVKAMARLYRSLDDEQRAVFDDGYAMIGSLSVSAQPALHRTAD